MVSTELLKTAVICARACKANGGNLPRTESSFTPLLTQGMSGVFSLPALHAQRDQLAWCFLSL